MLANSETTLIGKRYILQDQLGAGGMGEVHKANDRLSGKTIALKRVTTPTEQLDFLSRGQETDLRIALANEFKTLASVRHPHIISVLDYGFDAHRQPYFTMNLLDDPLTIVQAGKGQSFEDQVRLLTALLQSLSYLHRRNIIHRDLKPANVMVIKDTSGHFNQVKVLDFGLSIVVSEVGTTLSGRMSGTIAYMAPELFQGQQASKSSDLYAVGLIAYELFANRYPFDMSNIGVLINNILNTEVDLNEGVLSQELGTVIERLLAKDPKRRYEVADEVIRDLCLATLQPLPSETVEIRESFLQSARFVGRDDELSELSTHLSNILIGKGSACLVGGESGIGKSRLLEELRTVALVRGALVIRGQAISEGGNPYQVWRDVMRWLCLLENITDDEATILKTAVPDISVILGREVGDAPFLDPQVSQQQLLEVVSSILRRQKQPVVIILEDLQWAGSESIVMLERLSQIVLQLPVFIIGNYRDDERSTLPRELPTMRVIKLNRLTEVGVAMLSESMIGTSGRKPELVALLQRETEGNIFFVVEMLRTLAEEAGELGLIGRNGLPEKILAGGIQRIIQRRLDRVIPEARMLLQRAAILGRALDLTVLRAIDTTIDIDKWLDICSGAAVIDVQDRRWRFAHDKLREAIIAEIPQSQFASIHREVAQVIESVYPNTNEYAATLAHLWRMAKDTSKELYYSRVAGEQASLISANVEAINYFNRSLELLKTLPETPERLGQELGLEITIGASVAGLKGWGTPEAVRAYTRAYELSQQLGKIPTPVWFGLWVYAFMRSGSKANDDKAYELALQITDLARESEDVDLIVAADHVIGNTLSALGQLTEGYKGHQRTFSARDLVRRKGLALRFGHDPLMICMSWAAHTRVELGYPDEGVKIGQEAIMLGEEFGHPASLIQALTLSAWSYLARQDWKMAQEQAEIAISYGQKHQLGYWIALATIFRGSALAGQDQAIEAIDEIKRGMARYQAAGSMLVWRNHLRMLAEAYSKAGQLDQAISVLDEGLALDWGGIFDMAETYRLKGEIKWMQLASEAEVEDLFQKSLTVAREQNAKWWELRTTVSLCRLWHKQGKTAEAKAALTTIIDWFTEGFDTTDLQEAKAFLVELS